MLNRPERFDADSAREQWDYNAEGWNHAQREGLDHYRTGLHGPALVDFAGDVDGKKLLDLGCGEGYFSRQMAEQGASVIGVDLSPQQLDNARALEAEKPLGIEYRETNASDLAEEFGEESFDIVTACMSLMDMPEPERAISAAASILRPGGRFIFNITHPCFQTPYREWHRDSDGNKIALKVGDYFKSGPIELNFVAVSHLYDMKTTQYHATLTQWFHWITNAGLIVHDIHEPRPTEEAIRGHPALADAEMVAYFISFDARKP
ncbi:MAG: class I SAM-dependent methyltransferase [Chloroflexi bacterium]|nr:class I SAM-dependent methyltransferase [Chloroflexota bacterium]